MSSVNITYFVHSTCVENEKGSCIGWNPGQLSELGLKQSHELRDTIRDKQYDVVVSSDLKRAADTSEIVFRDRVPVILDSRLREMNYGDLNGAEKGKVVPHLLNHISEPFPNGECYNDVRNRVHQLIDELAEEYNGENVAFMSHWAPQIALAVIINNKTWKQALGSDWRSKVPKAWQPGWVYRYER